MKKLVSVVLSILLCLSLCALAEDNADKVVDTVDLTTDKGNFKYIGIEKADPNFVNDTGVKNKDMVVLLLFDFTSTSIEPNRCNSSFTIGAYQSSGVALKTTMSYNNCGEQYDLRSNYSTSILNGTTLTVAIPVELEDDSPLTVYAYELLPWSFGSTTKADYQIMEIDVSSVLN